MSNQPSIKRMFMAMAERVQADEPWQAVLDDYGLTVRDYAETDNEVLAAWNAQEQRCSCEACCRIDPSRLMSVVPAAAAPSGTREPEHYHQQAPPRIPFP